MTECFVHHCKDDHCPSNTVEHNSTEQQTNTLAPKSITCEKCIMMQKSDATICLESQINKETYG